MPQNGLSGPTVSSNLLGHTSWWLVLPFPSPFNPIKATLDVIYLFIYLFSKDVTDSYQGRSRAFFLVKQWLTSSHRSVSSSAVAGDASGDRRLFLLVFLCASVQQSHQCTHCFLFFNVLDCIKRCRFWDYFISPLFILMYSRNDFFLHIQAFTSSTAIKIVSLKKHKCMKLQFFDLNWPSKHITSQVLQKSIHYNKLIERLLEWMIVFLSVATLTSS